MARASREPARKSARRPSARVVAAAKPKPKKKAPAKKITRAKVTPKKATARTAAAKKKAPKKATGAKTAKPAPKKKVAPKKASAKAAATPAAATPAPPKKKVKPEVTPREIRKIKTTLEEQRAVLLKEYSDLEEGSLISQSEASGEVSFDEEFADAGSYTFEREKEMSIGQNIQDLVSKVNRALEAIDRGRYGICERCGNAIAKARVMALPYTTLCLTCKQQDERAR